VLGIGPAVVPDLFCRSLRSVVEFPPLLSGVFRFVAAESRDDGLGTSRCIHLSQEPVGHVFVLGIGPVVVTDLFHHCLRSVVEFPLLLFGLLHVCRSRFTG